MMIMTLCGAVPPHAGARYEWGYDGYEGRSGGGRHLVSPLKLPLKQNKCVRRVFFTYFLFNVGITTQDGTMRNLAEHMGAIKKSCVL